MNIKEDQFYYIDENGNKWDKHKYSLAQVRVAVDELENCFFCTNCFKCKDCIKCIRCFECIKCIGCSFGIKLIDCIKCDDCTDCKNCIGCKCCGKCNNIDNRKNWNFMRNKFLTSIRAIWESWGG